MKRLLTLILIFFMVACQNKNDMSDEIDLLKAELKEDNTNELTYINLFKAQIINQDYFDAVRTLDKGLMYGEGEEIEELIVDLKDGYDDNDNLHSRILIDYDINFDPFYVDNRNVDYYQGKSTTLKDRYYGVPYLLSSNNQELFKKSNYTVYILDENDVITDIYHHVYEIARKSFDNVKEEHYRVKYNDDGYIVRKNNVLDANSYKEYTYLENYTKVFVCGIYEYPDRTSKDCETFELIH